jgi:hypothetical protein
MKLSYATMVIATLICSCAGVKATPPPGGGSGGTHGAGFGGSPGTGFGGQGVGDPTHDCVNLECQQTTCLAARCLVPACGETQLSKTTLSGTIYDPAGKVPLYNVMVYIPNAALDPIREGVSCDQCSGTASGHPIASALTDAAGHFTLENPPIGKNIPLVIQVGKWRREVMVPQILGCSDNTLSDVNLSRLPRNQAEGHIPLIALTTGHSDALECLLRKIGIADEEFTTDAGAGRVHMFVGGDVPPKTGGQGAASFASSGQAFPNAATLWSDPTKLASYDMMMLSCEGSQYASAKSPYYANIKQYADTGGRIFDDHLHFNWILKGPAPWPTTAGWIGVGPDLGDVTAKIDISFPKGSALADWLSNVGASPTKGQIGITMAQDSVSSDMQPISQRWIYTDAPTAAVQYLTFNTPVEAPSPAMQCGRVVFTDIHVSASSGDTSHPETPFPNGCTSTVSSPQEKALEFMFFDLSSCVIDDRNPPQPPTIIP